MEAKPDVMPGAFVLRGTRVPAQAVIDNADDGYTSEQIVTEIYPSLPVEPTRRVIAFPGEHKQTDSLTNGPTALSAPNATT